MVGAPLGLPSCVVKADGTHVSMPLIWQPQATAQDKQIAHRCDVCGMARTFASLHLKTAAARTRTRTRLARRKGGHPLLLRTNKAVAGVSGQFCSNGSCWYAPYLSDIPAGTRRLWGASGLSDQPCSYARPKIISTSWRPGSCHQCHLPMPLRRGTLPGWNSQNVGP